MPPDLKFDDIINGILVFFNSLRTVARFLSNTLSSFRLVSVLLVSIEVSIFHITFKKFDLLNKTIIS